MADDPRFFDNGDGTLTHLDSGLTWMRCSLGQQWQNNNCRGQARSYPWLAAQQAMATLNREGGYAGAQDWRLPDLSELATITELRCRDPRINLRLFPRTPSTPYWSRSKKTANHIYAMDFDRQGVIIKTAQDTALVRLVRGRH